MAEAPEQVAKFDNPFDKMVLDSEHCFLCGDHLQTDHTREHVFPKWLLEEHNLWDEAITLLNGTTIPYRQMTVGCCKSCNTEELSQLESTVKEASERGYEAVSQLDDLVLFQWCGKIFWGLLFKEMSLAVDRKDPGKGTIMTEDFLSKLDVMHGLLQSVYRPFEFPSGKPFSVLVANLYELPEPDHFHFHDNLFLLTFGIRFGNVGIIVAIEDTGINDESYGKYLEDVAGRKLHPVQFDELFAKVTYNAKRLKRTPKYMFALPEDENEKVQFVSLPLGGLSQGSVVEEWDQEEFAHLLATIWRKWGFDFDELFEPPNLVRSWMQDENGDLLLFEPEDFQ